MGRPSDFTVEMGDRICAILANGKSIRTACEPDDMPDRETVFRWRRTNPDFAEAFDAARREGAHAMVDDIQDIVDSNGLDPNDKRVRMDARRWIASKMLPRYYGDKVQVGGDPDGAPLEVVWGGASIAANTRA